MNANVPAQLHTLTHRCRHKTIKWKRNQLEMRHWKLKLQWTFRLYRNHWQHESTVNYHGYYFDLSFDANLNTLYIGHILSIDCELSTFMYYYLFFVKNVINTVRNNNRHSFCSDAASIIFFSILNIDIEIIFYKCSVLFMLLHEYFLLKRNISIVPARLSLLSLKLHFG